MDDQPFAAEPAPREYRCPGQAYTIDRAVHLARLAAFYPTCLQCAHRDDARELSPLQVRAWAEVERRAPRGPKTDSEGIEGAMGAAIDVVVVHRVAAALAAGLWRQSHSPARPPAVLVGSDGSWTSADFVPAACEALQTAGCRAVEVGAVTSPCLAAAAHHLRAEAALWVGNASGEARSCRIKLWHDSGRPSSSPGALESVWADCEAPIVRPKRGGGRLERFDAAAVYLRSLGGLYHALRPLVFVLDTTCQTLARYWHKLGSQSACRMVPFHPGLADNSNRRASPPAAAGRRESLAREVVIEGAHFGIWVDGDGETCQLVDERGRWVDGERLLLALCRYVCRTRGGAGVVLEPAAGVELEREIERLGAKVFRGAPTRQGMCECIESAGAVVGGGADGRYWYSGPPAMSDALWCLSMLISMLSQSDRPLSEVLDGASEAG